MPKGKTLAAKRQTYESPRQLARRAAILEATRELLTKRGYEGTTVRDVAERARVAKGTLYNIYGGKDELIFAAVIDVRDDIIGLTDDLVVGLSEQVCQAVANDGVVVGEQDLHGGGVAPYVASGMVSSTMKLSFSERNIAAMINSNMNTASAKFFAMSRIAPSS